MLSQEMLSVYDFTYMKASGE